jgi:hypothetical protein
MKNCITYLLRSTQEDIDMLNKSLSLLEINLLSKTKNYDVIIFHENNLGDLKNKINTNIKLIFHEVSIDPPKYSDEINSLIPEFFPHPTHGNGPIAYGHKGFTMGYRNMCRFFSGTFHKLPILSNYEYYLRLDTDSYILTELNYDIFEFAKQTDLIYGYCEPAVQIDNPKVVEGLKEFSKNYIELNNVKTYIDVNTIPEGKMFYTNLELGKVDWFIKSEYINYFNTIDENGGIYIKRWGDAPIKYLGVNLFCDPLKIIPLKGFTYQHGAVYYL